MPNEEVYAVLEEAGYALIVGLTTLEEVAARLIEHDCQGTRKNSLKCPLALWYTRYLIPARVDLEAVALDRVYARELSATHLIVASVPLPSLAARVRSAFDAGDLPQLELGYRPPPGEDRFTGWVFLEKIRYGFHRLLRKLRKH